MQGRKGLIIPLEENQIKASEKEIELTFQFSNNTNSISVFPSQDKGLFEVKLHAPNNVSQLRNLEIFDLLGRKIISSSINAQTFQLDLSAQPKGVYLLQTNDGEILFNKKIMVQ